jgi:hypothetical protein
MNRNLCAFAFSLLLATSVTLAAPPSAPAPPPAGASFGHAGMHMDGMDMEHGGMHVGADTQKTEFDQLDANHDGKLSKAELPAKHPLAPHFGMLDTNKDGTLSRSEFAPPHGM